MYSRISEIEGICEGYMKSASWQKPTVTHPTEMHSCTYVTSRTVNKWKPLRDHLCALCKKMDACESEHPGLSLRKSESQWRLWQATCLLILCNLKRD